MNNKNGIPPDNETLRAAAGVLRWTPACAGVTKEGGHAGPPLRMDPCLRRGDGKGGMAFSWSVIPAQAGNQEKFRPGEMVMALWVGCLGGGPGRATIPQQSCGAPVHPLAP